MKTLSFHDFFAGGPPAKKTLQKILTKDLFQSIRRYLTSMNCQGSYEPKAVCMMNFPRRKIIKTGQHVTILMKSF